MAKSSERMVKHTLNLFEGDYRRIQDLYPDVGAGSIIRRLVRNFLDKVDAAGGIHQTDTEVNI